MIVERLLLAQYVGDGVHKFQNFTFTHRRYLSNKATEFPFILKVDSEGEMTLMIFSREKVLKNSGSDL